MLKITLALGNKSADDALKAMMKEEAVFTSSAIYFDQIVDILSEYSPDVLIITEALSGFDYDKLTSLRLKNENLRIILLAKETDVIDKRIGKLILFGVYDIIFTNSIKLETIREKIYKKSTIADVKDILPKSLIEDLIEIPDDAKINVVSERVGDKEKLSETYIEKFEKKEKKNYFLKSKKVDNKDQTTKRKEVPVNELTDDLKHELTLEDAMKMIKDAGFDVNKISEKKDNKEAEPVRKPKQIIKEKIVKETKQTRSQIVTFVGARNNIGTSLISLSAALALSKKGYKTLYVDFSKDNLSTIRSWFLTGDFKSEEYKKGLDKAMMYFENENYQKAKEQLFNAKRMNELNEFFDETFPDNFYSLSYSIEHEIDENKPELSPKIFLDLMILYMQSLHFDYIIIDVNDNKQSGLISILNAYSNLMFFINTQDIVTNLYLKELLKRIQKSESETLLIINQFDDKNDMSEKSFKELLYKKIFLIENSPIQSRNIAKGKSPYIFGGDKVFIKRINNILDYILKESL